MASRNVSASKKKSGSTGPLLDYQGNVLPRPGSQDKYCKPSPIPRLAAVEDLSRPIPTAGWYGIEHVKPYEVSIPPESYLYDGDRTWVLGKLDKAALDVPEPAEPLILSKELQEKLNKMEAAANADLARRRGLKMPVTEIETETEVNANPVVEKKVKSKSESGSPVSGKKSGAARPVSQGRRLKRRTSKSKSPGRSGDAPGSPLPKLVTTPKSTFKKVVNPK